MANKKDKNNSSDLFGSSVDPQVEEKVDNMMSLENIDTPEKVDAKDVVDEQIPESTEAPIIPSDELPSFEDKLPLPAQDEAPSAEIDKDQTIAEAEQAQEEAKTTTDLGPVDDATTDKAVDDIVKEESNALLATEDAKIKKANEPTPKRSFGQKIKAFFRAWWSNPLYRKLTIASILIVVVALAVVPASRYFVLNTVGVRSSSSVIVLDQKTSQPLKNVEVSIASQSSKTDKEGRVQLNGIKLGPQQLVIKKPAFAEVNQKVTIGWGSNPLGQMKLTPVGSQYTFRLSDFISNKPVKDAEATSGESSAVANSDGEIVLTLPNTKEAEVEVEISANNYRTEKLKLEVANKESKDIKMVSAHKHAFVSKRSGKYDVYKIDVDGNNEQKVFEGTGTEREDSMSLVPHQTKNLVAFVSGRSDARNQDGYVLNSLNIINLDTNEVDKITASERIQVVGWQNDRLVYVKITQGASASSTDRHKLMSYDMKSEDDKELAKTNYFNDVMLAGGAIYYSPALYKVNGPVGLYKVNADGTNRQTVMDKEVWNLFRTSYDTIAVSVGQDWYEYQISSGKLAKANNPPAQLKSRVYIDAPSGKKSLWVDERDGKGVLLAFDVDTNADRSLQNKSGLKNPVEWLDGDHIVYRIANSQETADFVMSLSGGEPKKISDVTNIAGVERWYYY